MHLSSLLYPLLLLTTPVFSINFDISNEKERNDNLALIAKGLMDYYKGHDYGETPGMFSWPYYWWEAGAAWNSMLSYWYYTGDTTYNTLLKDSLLFQVGDDWNYMPINQTTTEGNDDQGFWGVTVMAAAEFNFSNPDDNQPQWLYLADAVFNTMAARWDYQHCGGGLRWQIFTWNNGYNYKNTVSNGCLFNIGARLARYTKNDTYKEWAEKVWNWIEDVAYIDTSQPALWPVYDGGVIGDNCTEHTRLEWTYNYGLFISGCAVMYNYTGDAVWAYRLENIWNRAKVFFMADSQILHEAACQPSGMCNNDQRCFKAIFSRFMALTMLMAPSNISDSIFKYMEPSVAGVMNSCSGGSDGHTCGLNWGKGSWDGIYGLGEQMSALELLLSRLIWTKPGPLTNNTGGTSTSNFSLVGSSNTKNLLSPEIEVKTKDRVGAGIITAVVILLLLGTAGWIMM